MSAIAQTRYREPEMPDDDCPEPVRGAFLGEIETEIAAMEHHQGKILPGEQVNMEREGTAIRVENGLFEPVGYLPRKLASWLAPLIDSGQIHLDGYVPNFAPTRCPLVLMVFQCEPGLLEKADPTNELEALHQTVLQAYQSAQGYRDAELILRLAKRLRPLEKQKLLPETRLLLALMPRMAREVCMAQGVRTMVRFRELLGKLTIGQPAHHHNLTFFPLLWPEVREPAYTLLSEAVMAGEAVVEEVPNLTVTNHCDRPLLIPEGELLTGAKQVSVTVLVAAGAKFVLPVRCLGPSRWRPQPALPHRKQTTHATSGQGEVWDEVRKCLAETDAIVAAEEKLKEHCKRLVFPEGAAGILVGRHDRIIGMDLFDSPTTLRTLWDRLADAYFFDALRDPKAASATSADDARQFIERVSGAAKPRVPALGLGDELEIAGKGLVGAALLYDGRLCHLAAFSSGEG